MKKKATLFAILFAASILAAGCTRETLEPETQVAVNAAGHVLVPFSAKAGEIQTRVTIEDGDTQNMMFTRLDKVLVYNRQLLVPSLLTLSSGALTTTATFSGSLELLSGKTEADLAGATLHAILIPGQSVFQYDASTQTLTVDYSSAIDTDLPLLVGRTILYEGSTKYEDRKFSFVMQTSYLRLSVPVKEFSDADRTFTMELDGSKYPSSSTLYTNNLRVGSSSLGDCFVSSKDITFKSSTGGVVYAAVFGGMGSTYEGVGEDVEFTVKLTNKTKGYVLEGRLDSPVKMVGGKGYRRTVTLSSPAGEDILKNTDAAVRRVCLANWDLNEDGALSRYEASQVTELGAAFQQNKNIESLNVLTYFNGLTSISASAFFDCTKLKNIAIPSSVTQIHSHAFRDCSSLQSIVLPDGVNYIGEYAFSGCRSLYSFYGLQKSRITYIGNNAFTNCVSLQYVELPSTLKDIGTEAFLNSGLKTVTIPAAVNKMRSHCFSSCASLTSVTMEGTIPPVLEGPIFFECNALTKIYLPSRTAYFNYKGYSYWGDYENLFVYPN
ncbi:MAG: leucine-rich repeat domain-containing protein [Bacteroidales bacterium]|nr:leucine-rich repeat domain-containing protein [Bacteroidales bacterium]